jgi:hypothetical protein
LLERFIEWRDEEMHCADEGIVEGKTKQQREGHKHGERRGHEDLRPQTKEGRIAEGDRPTNNQDEPQDGTEPSELSSRSFRLSVITIKGEFPLALWLHIENRLAELSRSLATSSLGWPSAIDGHSYLRT